MTELVVSNVEKQIGELKALRGVSFSIRAGELVATSAKRRRKKHDQLHHRRKSAHRRKRLAQEQRIGDWPPYQANRAEVARTFQAGELFRN